VALFSYKAVRPDGELQSGEMEAADEQALIKRLQEEGLIPIETRLAGGIAGGWRAFGRSRRKRLPPEQLALLTQELATLLEAGMTLDRSLQILHDLSDHAQTARLLADLKSRVESGAAFSAALEAQGDHFPPLYVSMVKAGEAGGVLQPALHRLADYLERSAALRESIWSALLYPLILLVVSGLSVILLLMFVVPQFSQMFADMGQALPLPTRIVIALGDLFRGYWWLLLAALLLSVAVIRSLLTRPANRYRWDRRLLRLPLIGELVAKVETARFTSTLATLMENGLTLLEALDLARGVITNRVIAESIELAAGSLKRGRGLAGPLIELGVLPRLALQMIKVGEESGALEGMLGRVADIYDREVRTSVKHLLTLLEPILIVGLGLIVAGIIVSILMAMLGANQLVL